MTKTTSAAMASRVRPPLAKGDDGSANRYPSRVAPVDTEMCVRCLVGMTIADDTIDVDLANYPEDTFPGATADWATIHRACDVVPDHVDTIEAYDRQRDDDLTDRA